MAAYIIPGFLQSGILVFIRSLIIYPRMIKKREFLLQSSLPLWFSPQHQGSSWGPAPLIFQDRMTASITQPTCCQPRLSWTGPLWTSHHTTWTHNTHGLSAVQYRTAHHRSRRNSTSWQLLDTKKECILNAKKTFLLLFLASSKSPNLFFVLLCFLIVSGHLRSACRKIANLSCLLLRTLDYAVCIVHRAVHMTATSMHCSFQTHWRDEKKERFESLWRMLQGGSKTQK